METDLPFSFVTGILKFKMKKVIGDDRESKHIATLQGGDAVD
jgi:hypothetical protein